MTERPPVPLADRTLDAYVPGLVETHGPLEVSESDIVAFASSFDPHDMHVDPEAARRGQFGGLIASGWHTTALMMRLMVGGFLNQRASIASPGVDELRWLKPVYPGDVLRCETEILDKRASQSRPEMGSYRSRMTVLNQDDAPVMTFISIGLIATRPAG